MTLTDLAGYARWNSFIIAAPVTSASASVWT